MAALYSSSFGSQSRASSLQTHYGSRAPEQRAHARATAAIDDCRIKNAAVFNAQGITLRRPNLQSGRPVADVVKLVLVDAISTDRGGVGAARRNKIPAWSRRMGHSPIAGSVPRPIPDRYRRVQHGCLLLSR